MLFGAHIPAGTLAAHVAHHRELHAERLAGYERRLKKIAGMAEPPSAYALASLDFGVRYERAVLSWFDALPEEIRGQAG